ncbi:hypothetical protein D3C76_1003410 [compost metagenome]
MYELTANEATYVVKLSLDRVMERMAQTAEMINSNGLMNGTSVEVFASTLEEVGKYRIQSEKTDYNLYAGFTLMFMMVSVKFR